MKSKRLLLMGSVVIILFASILFNCLSQRPLLWNSGPRLKMALRSQNGSFGTNWWNSFNRELQVVSNHFATPRMTASLAQSLGADSGSFQFSTVRPVRGTSLIEVHFRSGTSNIAWCIAQIASKELVGFCATNNPDVVLEKIDDRGVFCFRESPWWKDEIDRLVRLFRR